MAYTWDKAPSSRVGVSYVFTASSTSTPTSTFGPQTYQIRIATTTGAIFFKVGQATVTADSTSGHALGTNLVDYVSVTPGQQCAVVGTGPVSITEMS
jgi:hypothetical protein